MDRYEAPDNTARVIAPGDLIGAQETCALLGIDRSTLTRRIQSGAAPMPLAQLDGPGGAYVFDRADVVAAAAHTASIQVVKKGPAKP